MFLSFQLLEKGFEQPRMTGWGNNAVLARLVDALDKRTGQTELDELEPSPLLYLIIRGNGAALVDQDFDVAMVSGGRFFGFRLRFTSQSHENLPCNMLRFK